MHLSFLVLNPPATGDLFVRESSHRKEQTKVTAHFQLSSYCCLSMQVSACVKQRTAVTARFLSKQLLLFAFASLSPLTPSPLSHLPTRGLFVETLSLLIAPRCNLCTAR